MERVGPCKYKNCFNNCLNSKPRINCRLCRYGGAYMLQNVVKVYGHRKIRVHKSFTKLQAALHGATALEYKLLKDKSPNNDSLDSLVRINWK